MNRPRRARGRSALAATIAATAVAVAGCAADPTDSELERILAAVPDADMQQLWRDAHADGRLDGVDLVPADGEDWVFERDLGSLGGAAQFADATPPQAGGFAPGDPLGDVSIFSRVDLDDFAGAVDLLGASPGLVVGLLPDGVSTFELRLTLPDGGLLAIDDAPAAFDLSVEDEVFAMAQQQVVHARGPDGTYLFKLSQGSTEPYERTFDEPSLSVRQLPPGNDGVAPVVLTLGGTTATLVPDAEPVRIVTSEGTLEAILLTSIFTPAELVALVEGNPFYVELVIYRAKS